MSCRRLRDSLIQYVDQDIEGPRLDEVKAHLASCADCRSAVEKLELSRAATSSLDRLSMSQAAAEGVFRAMKAEADRKPTLRESLADRLGFLWSPRAAGAAGMALAVVLSILVIVVVYTTPGKETSPTRTLDKAVSNGTQGSTPAEYKAETASPVPGLAATIMPVVKVSQNDYDQNSLKSSFDNMEVRKKIANEYSMSHCVQYGEMYRKKVADMMVDAGQDGAMLEAMMAYVTSSEPVLLPYYAEHARYSGQLVFIVGFAGPRRTGKSNMLTRTEVWVMSPEKFPSSPDSSIVYFMQQQSQ